MRAIDDHRHDPGRIGGGSDIDGNASLTGRPENAWEILAELHLGISCVLASRIMDEGLPLVAPAIAATHTVVSGHFSTASAVEASPGIVIGTGEVFGTVPVPY